MSVKNLTENSISIAFYNLENLYDVYLDSHTLDSDFTPKGKYHWTLKRYQKKIKKLGSVISEIGKESSKISPILLGVCEIENKRVLHDLIESPSLKDKSYQFVHYNSSDERGIDVALLYKSDYFSVIDSKPIPLVVFNEKGQRDFTRDILYVKGKLNNELVHILVNHWPSRGKNKEITEQKRIVASNVIHHFCEKITEKEPEAHIIIMGDFNDNPTNESVSHLATEGFINPFKSLLKPNRGSLLFNKHWLLFDQIIFSSSFLNKERSLVYQSANIMDVSSLKQWKGKQKGAPFRTYIGPWYKGGFSDHFPVYIVLKKQ